ncbi:SPFH domain-containing protein [Terrabacter sp. 2RAF25]|uniref:SPFH domain-containing protein n=1 Tax=Terrabacter sp. 2RAF25 TaxID=3232998 RepID=UPI003F9A2B72
MSLMHFTIQPRHCALRYRQGVLEQVLPAGRHRRVRAQRLVVLDLRERLIQVAPQEVLASDGVSVRVSAVVRWAVGDPVAFAEVAEDPAATVYLAAQVALRDALATLTADDVVGRGAALPTARISAATAEVARRVGVEVAEVVVKDVIVPVELRVAAAELATARRRGEAQLEAARAETAALRSLANGAKLLDAHPALARLRLVQSAPPGTRIVLGVPDVAALVVDD